MFLSLKKKNNHKWKPADGAEPATQASASSQGTDVGALCVRLRGLGAPAPPPPRNLRLCHACGQSGGSPCLAAPTVQGWSSGGQITCWPAAHTLVTTSMPPPAAATQAGTLPFALSVRLSNDCRRQHLRRKHSGLAWRAPTACAHTAGVQAGVLLISSRHCNGGTAHGAREHWAPAVGPWLCKRGPCVDWGAGAGSEGTQGGTRERRAGPGAGVSVRGGSEPARRALSRPPRPRCPTVTKQHPTVATTSAGVQTLRARLRLIAGSRPPEGGRGHWPGCSHTRAGD